MSGMGQPSLSDTEDEAGVEEALRVGAHREHRGRPWGVAPISTVLHVEPERAPPVDPFGPGEFGRHG